MRRLLLAVLLASPAAVAGSVDAPILGGTATTVGQYPTVVAVEVGGGLCTGTLITQDWVLTAAHCVSPAELHVASQAAVTSGLRIHINTVNAFANGGMTLTASDSIPDPMWSQPGANDSGLIKLSAPYTATAPSIVNLDPANAPVGTAVTMVGFGATAVGGGGNVGVEYVVNQTSVACSSFGALDKNLLCYNQSSGKGKCNGDSGGPSFAMIGGKLVEVGITSFGDQSCGSFGADTRTDAEAAFIKSHVPELYCEIDTDCPMAKQCFEHKCIVMPFAPSGLGSTCTGASDCDSNTCATGDGGGKCTMACSVGTPTTCPMGFDCIVAGSGGVCWPPTAGGGCCDAGGRGAPTGLLGLALVGLVLRRRRRR